MSGDFEMTIGGRTVRISTVDAIEMERLPPYPAGDEKRLAKWQGKKITTTAKETREYLARIFGAHCHLCDQPIDMALPHAHPAAPQIDHLVPTSSGGANTWGNVALSHRTCNSSKNDLRGGVREPDVYRRKLADALFIHEGSGAVVLERALHQQRWFDEPAETLAFGRIARGRKQMGIRDDEWENVRAELEHELDEQRPELEAAWARAEAVLTALGYPSATRTVQPRMHEERPEIDSVLARMQEKLAAREAEGDGMTQRLRETINLLQRTQATLDADLGGGMI